MSDKIKLIKSGVDVDLTRAIVKFGAPWCGPCKKISQHFISLSNGFGDSINFYEVNIDDYETSDTVICDIVNSISSIPMIVIIKDGVVVYKVLGTKLDSLKIELDKICPEEEVEDVSEIVESHFEEYTQEARKKRMANRTPRTVDDLDEVEVAIPPEVVDNEPLLDMSEHFDSISRNGVVLFDESGAVVDRVLN